MHSCYALCISTYLSVPNGNNAEWFMPCMK